MSWSCHPPLSRALKTAGALVSVQAAAVGSGAIARAHRLRAGRHCAVEHGNSRRCRCPNFTGPRGCQECASAMGARRPKITPCVRSAGRTSSPGQREVGKSTAWDWDQDLARGKPWAMAGTGSFVAPGPELVGSTMRDHRTVLRASWLPKFLDPLQAVASNGA